MGEQAKLAHHFRISCGRYDVYRDIARLKLRLVVLHSFDIRGKDLRDGRKFLLIHRQTEKLSLLISFKMIHLNLMDRLRNRYFILRFNIHKII